MAAIQLSKLNVADFIRARGQGVPISLSPTSVKGYIQKFCEHWAINLTKMPKGLVATCLRVGATKAEEAIRAILPEVVEKDGKLVRYLVENAMRVGAEAAETGMNPWILGNAHHTNHHQQEAGKAAQDRIQLRSKLLEAWKQTASVRTVPPSDDYLSWRCVDANTVITTTVEYKAALAQNLVADGKTEIEACKFYADANGIGWPDGIEPDGDA